MAMPNQNIFFQFDIDRIWTAPRNVRENRLDVLAMMKQELVADSVHERNSYFDVDDLDYFCFRNRGKIKKPRAWAINTDPNMDRE
jgi:hypothetical protein